MKLWTKLLQVPVSNARKQIVAVQMWEVRWRSRRGQYDCDGFPEMEAFPSLDAAEHFRDALVNAFRLTRCQWGTEVELSKVRLDNVNERVA